MMLEKLLGMMLEKLLELCLVEVLEISLDFWLDLLLVVGVLRAGVLPASPSDI